MRKFARLFQTPVDSWVNRPWFDYILTAIFVGSLLYFNPMSTVKSTDHGAWYQTLAAMSAVFLTVGLVVSTLVFTVTPTKRLTLVLRVVGVPMQRIIFRCLAVLAVCTVGFSMAFTLEQQVSSTLRRGVIAALISLCLLSAGRLLWIFRTVLVLLIMSVREPADQISIDDGETWQRPEVHDGDYDVAHRVPARS